MNTTNVYGLNYTISFSAASVSGITSWDVAVNVRYSIILGVCLGFSHVLPPASVHYRHMHDRVSIAARVLESRP